jgi:reactive chlorine resistance protein C
VRTVDQAMKALFNYTERLAGPLLRITLGVVLLWIGCIHVVDPQPVVALLLQSLPFLAFNAFVYLLGGLEVIVGILLLAGLWIRYVALLSLVLFAGTLTIFVVAPAVTGLPLLTLMGQFILKDTVLASAAITLVARDAASHEAGLAQDIQPSSRPKELGGQITQNG